MFVTGKKEKTSYNIVICSFIILIAYNFYILHHLRKKISYYKTDFFLFNYNIVIFNS